MESKENKSSYEDTLIDPGKLDDIEIYGWVWQWFVSGRW